MKKKSIRLVNVDNSIIIHGRDPKGHPVVTVALDDESRNWGVSVCSPDDNISKRVGRAKARGRLYSKIIKGSDKVNAPSTLIHHLIKTEVRRKLKGKRAYKEAVILDLSTKIIKTLDRCYDVAGNSK